jgi:hypothetical protein
VKPGKKFKSIKEEYKATVILTQADGEKLTKAMIDAQATFRKSEKAKTGKTLPNGEMYRLKQKGTTDDNGNFIADASGTYELKLQRDVEKGKIKIIDCSIPPEDITTKAPAIAEGSSVRVMLTINPYNDKGKVSVSLTPVAVQLVELVEYGGVSMEEITDGFGEFEGGYVASESSVEESTSETTEEVDEEQGF